jgi:hypothetical protein
VFVRRNLFAFLIVCLAVPAIALAADTDPKRQITTADETKARSTVLKRTDFAAGWKKVAPSPDEDLTCPGFNPDGSDLTLTGDAEADFEHAQGSPRISSFTDVYISKGDALKSWARTVKPALARCMAHFIREEFVKAGGTVTIVKQGRIAFPKLAPRTDAFRVVANVTVEPPGEPAVKIPFTIHLVALGRGRAEAGLLTMGLGTGVSTADLRAFAKAIAARLAAAKL